MANPPTLALSRRIVKAYISDDFLLGIIHGKPRIGKSAYCIKAMGQAIDYLFGEDIYNPKVCQKYMGWDPEENVDRWIEIDSDRIPCYTWDDAGYWLFSLNWSDPLLIAVQKYFNVIGTDMNCILLNTPDPTWILSKIAKIPEMMRIKIMKRSGGQGDSDYFLFSRRAKGYIPYRSPDLKKHGVNKAIEDDYSCKLPDDFYKWYKPTRERYAKIAKLEIKRNLIERRRKRGETRGRPKKHKNSGD